LATLLLRGVTALSLSVQLSRVEMLKELLREMLLNK
jgi:hypothetical protein